MNVEYVGGSATFTLTSNTDWTINNHADWLTVSPNSGFGTVDITINYSDNPRVVERSAELTITGGGITDTIKIIQLWQPFALMLNQKNLLLDYIEELQRYNTNFKYKLDCK